MRVNARCGDAQTITYWCQCGPETAEERAEQQRQRHARAEAKRSAQPGGEGKQPKPRARPATVGQTVRCGCQAHFACTEYDNARAQSTTMRY